MHTPMMNETQPRRSTRLSKPKQYGDEFEVSLCTSRTISFEEKLLMDLSLPGLPPIERDDNNSPLPDRDSPITSTQVCGVPDTQLEQKFDTPHISQDFYQSSIDSENDSDVDFYSDAVVDSEVDNDSDVENDSKDYRPCKMAESEGKQPKLTIQTRRMTSTAINPPQRYNDFVSLSPASERPVQGNEIDTADDYVMNILNGSVTHVKNLDNSVCSDNFSNGSINIVDETVISQPQSYPHLRSLMSMFTPTLESPSGDDDEDEMARESIDEGQENGAPPLTENSLFSQLSTANIKFDSPTKVSSPQPHDFNEQFQQLHSRLMETERHCRQMPKILTAVAGLQENFYKNVTLQKEKNDLEVKLLQADSEVNLQKGKIGDIQQHVQKLATDLKAANVRNAELEKKIEDLQSQISQTNPPLMSHASHAETQTPQVPACTYFRGWRNEFSAFFPCTLTPKSGPGAGLQFNSAEHLYHYRRLVHHDKPADAEKVRKTHTAGKAKILAERLLPPTSVEQKWNLSAQREMESITLLKFQQCEAFRKALTQSGNRSLLHNMENDETWGIGQYGTGKNQMGKALENVRERVKNDPNLAIVDSQTESDSVPDPTTNHMPNVLILSDSILDGTESFFDQKKNVTVLASSGCTVSEMDRILRSKLTDCSLYSHLVIHVGTNSLERESFKQIETTFRNMIKYATWFDEDLKIVLSGVLYRLDNDFHNNKIDTVNSLLQSMESDRVFFVDHNPTFKHLDRVLNSSGLHLRPVGKRQVVVNLEAAISGLTIHRSGKNTWPNHNTLPTRNQPNQRAGAPKNFNSEKLFQAGNRPQTDASMRRRHQSPQPRQTRRTQQSETRPRHPNHGRSHGPPRRAPLASQKFTPHHQSATNRWDPPNSTHHDAPFQHEPPANALPLVQTETMYSVPVHNPFEPLNRHSDPSTHVWNNMQVNPESVTHNWPAPQQDFPPQPPPFDSFYHARPWGF